MKNTYIKSLALAAATVFLGACAEKPEGTDNDSSKRYIEKWISVYYPGVEPYSKGIYILDEKLSDNGPEVKPNEFVLLDYDVRDLQGNIISTTDRETALKAGLPVAKVDYFGPRVLSTAPGSNFAGLLDGLYGMKVGGSRSILVPSWLMSTANYATEEEYLQHKTDKPETIYSYEVKDCFPNSDDYEIKMMLEYVSKYGMEMKDTVEKGFFFKPLVIELEKPEKPEGDKEEGKEEEKVDTTTSYINYTGKLLFKNYEKETKPVETKTFDSSIEKVAKDEGFYNSTVSYKAKKIVYGENFGETTLEDSKVIAGFAKTMWKMREKKAKKGIGVFYSKIGYGVNGSGNSIPGYSPLVFEIEIVEKPKK